jgi:hypothetical protein
MHIGKRMRVFEGACYRALFPIWAVHLAGPADQRRDSP